MVKPEWGVWTPLATANTGIWRAASRGQLRSLALIFLVGNIASFFFFFFVESLD